MIVPNTNHLKGIPAAAAAGIIAGKAEKELEVIAEVTEEQTKQMVEFLDTVPVSVEHPGTHPKTSLAFAAAYARAIGSVHPMAGTSSSFKICTYACRY